MYFDIHRSNCIVIENNVCKTGRTSNRVDGEITQIHEKRFNWIQRVSLGKPSRLTLCFACLALSSTWYCLPLCKLKQLYEIMQSTQQQLAAVQAEARAETAAATAAATDTIATTAA